ncbi:hypothetical protein [Bifidobacterium sp. ESL0745]|uniref:hypothetical protein n=1 Tax=Bifidobacterium sp. ESL0745 TaxID=2983226 RepID=UPI0023F7A24D|nr:hypothetical protein [Bifidobacterium sp. ESL0745]MDF7665703.1 hypothetical protein [Bifidobacterium sp. ESL0745]
MVKRDGFAKLSNGFWRSTKVRKLRRERPTALGLYALAISFCSDRLNDGHITDDELYYQLGADDDDIDALLDVRMLEDDGESGYYIHDYLDHQTSREKALEKAEKHRRAQARYIAGQNDESLINQCPVNDVSTLNTQNTKNPRTSLLSNDKSERHPLPDENEIREWKPKPDHRQQAMELVDKGYPLIDVDNLAKEFRNSLLSKGIEHYGYRNLDAAFDTWILKRSESKRDQHQNQIFQDTAFEGRTWQEPEKEPEHKTTYGIGSKRVLNLLGLDVADPSDWRLLALRDLFNEGKSDEAAMEELRQMEEARKKTEVTA